MTNLQRLQSVRHRLNQWFAQVTDQENPPQVEESLLIRDGYYCGRRFQIDGYSAIWFTEEDQIKVYDAEGRRVELAEPQQPISDANPQTDQETRRRAA